MRALDYIYINYKQLNKNLYGIPTFTYKELIRSFVKREIFQHIRFEKRILLCSSR